MGFKSIVGAVCACLAIASCNTNAATITAQGSVLALDNYSQLNGVLGVADFDSPHDAGITFHD